MLKRFRADPLVAGFRGAIDSLATTEELERIAPLIPEDWLAPAATGSPARCVEKIRGQFDLGADGVILHGASPADLEPIVDCYRESRDAGRFAHLAANPAASTVDHDRQRLRDRLVAGATSPKGAVADADYFDRLRGEVREAGR